MFICEFHSLKASSRFFTTTAFHITTTERNTVLDLLNKLTKSESEAQYDYYYEKFRNISCKAIVQSFDKNWHSIRNEGTRYSLSNNNYGSYTNNVVKSTNASLKREIEPLSSFKDFVDGFFRHSRRREESMKHCLTADIFKQPIGGYEKGTPEYLYQKHLTNGAFRKVIPQLKGIAQ